MSQQINLFNPIFLKQKKYFSAVTMAQALGLILLGCALMAAYANYQVAMLGKEADAMSAQLRAVQAQLGQVNATYAPKQKTASLEDDLRKTEADIRSLQQVFDILQKGEIGNTKGYADYMRAFARQIGGGVWLTGIAIHGAGNEIGLQGRALQPEQVPAYIGRLRREPVLQGKSFATLDMQAPSPEQNDKVETARQARAPYIEFRLHSSGIAKDGPQGVKTK